MSTFSLKNLVNSQKSCTFAPEFENQQTIDLTSFMLLLPTYSTAITPPHAGIGVIRNSYYYTPTSGVHAMWASLFARLFFN